MKPAKQRIDAVILGVVAAVCSFMLPVQSAAQSAAWETVLASLESALPLDPAAVPPVGTFYLLSDYLLTGHAAPYPFCPPVSSGAAVYLLRDDGGFFGGVFLVDDPACYGDAVQEAAAQDVGSGTGDSLSIRTSAMSAELDFLTEGDESGGTNEPPAMFTYSAGDLWLQIIEVTNSSAWFQVHSPETNAVYDLFATTNLGPTEPGLNVTTWIPVLRTEPGQTNLLVADLTANECFFILANTNDTDADGLSSAFEMLVSHTDPTE